MTPEIVQIVTYILAGLSIALAITAIILFFKLKIVKAIRELRGKTIIKAKNNFKSKNIASTESGVIDDVEDEDDGLDETIALVADENTYINFKIVKNIIYVNTAEIIG